MKILYCGKSGVVIDQDKSLFLVLFDDRSKFCLKLYEKNFVKDPQITIFQ